MSARNDGGPAFPIPGLHEDADFNGMTLRDYFAAKAMQAIIAAQVGNDGVTLMGEDYIANSAYAMADFMLMERAK